MPLQLGFLNCNTVNTLISQYTPELPLQVSMEFATNVLLTLHRPSRISPQSFCEACMLARTFCIFISKVQDIVPRYTFGTLLIIGDSISFMLAFGNLASTR